MARQPTSVHLFPFRKVHPPPTSLPTPHRQEPLHMHALLPRVFDSVLPDNPPLRCSAAHLLLCCTGVDPELAVRKAAGRPKLERTLEGIQGASRFPRVLHPK